MRRFALSMVVAAVVSSVGCTTEQPVNPRGSSSSGDPPEDSGIETPPEKVTVTEETVDVDGTAREYVLAVPKTYDKSRAYPLVLVLHGDGGDGPGMRQFHRFDAFSGDDAIVAYPTGINMGWVIYEPLSTNRDMQFLDTLVSSLSKKWNIDTTRVSGVGYSSGGYLINQMACRRNGFFRAIVAHAAGAPSEEMGDPGAGTWPDSGYVKCVDQKSGAEGGGVATLAIHGENDAPEGGEFIATYWASVNGCSENRTATSPSPCEQHEGCPAGKPVVWCRIAGLGHTVWNQGAKEGWNFIKNLE